MDIRELRKNNYVAYLDDTYQVNGWREMKGDIGNEFTRIWIKSGEVEVAKTSNWIKPIPLTEEWLERMGFSRIDGNGAGNVYGFIGDDMLVNDDLKFVYMFKGHGLPNMEEKFLRRNKEFKYVHQLQNLYFALTGSELTIKELV